MTDLGFRVSIYLFVWLLSFLSLSLLFSSLISVYLLSTVSQSVSQSVIHYQSSILVALLILSLTYLASLCLSVSLFVSVYQLINHHPYVILSSPSLPLSLFTIFSERHFFTGHSQRTSHTEHPIDTTFSFPSTQTQQDHTHHTTHSSSNEVFSVSSSSSSMRQDKTKQDMTWQDDWPYQRTTTRIPLGMTK